MAKRPAASLKLANLKRVDLAFESLSPKTQKQVKFLLKQEDQETLAQARKNDESILLGMEIVDVVDEATGNAKYQMFLFGSSDGYVLGADSTKAIAEIPQHDFLLLEFDPALHAQFEAAWIEGAKRLKIQHSVEFHEPRPPQPKRAPGETSFAERLAQLEARRTAAGPTNEDIFKNDNLLSPHTIQLVRDTLEPFRSLPARRPFELTADQRAALTFFATCDFGDMDLWMYGLPPKFSPDPQSALHRLLGLAPPTARDAVVSIDGQPHPIWCLVSDVVHGSKTPEIVLDLLFAQIGVEVLVQALQELTASREDTYQRKFVFTKREDFISGISPMKEMKTHQPQMDRYVDFLVAWSLRLEAKNPLDASGPAYNYFSGVVVLATQLARKQLSEASDPIFCAILSTTPGTERPLRRAIFKLLSALPLEHAMSLVKKDSPYAKLLAMPEKERKKSLAWFE